MAGCGVLNKINSSHIAKSIGRFGFTLHYFFTMLALFIPNTTAYHPITYTTILCQNLPMLALYNQSLNIARMQDSLNRIL